MKSLKELVAHLVSSVEASDIDDTLLRDPDYISGMLQISALEKIPAYISDDQLEAFVDASEKSFKESTFKQFIPDYETFLRELEADFWAGVMLGDVEME